MKRIKILHILHSFGIGGMEKGIATLVRHGSPQFEHVILCLSRSGESQDLLPPDTKVLALGKQEGNSLRFLWHLATTIRNEHPDVIHTRNWGGMDGIIAARLARVGTIVHGEHGWGMEDPKGLSPKRILIRRAFSYGVREFTGVSLQIKNWLEHTVKVRSPVTQIYNGVEPGDYPARGCGGKLRHELGLTAETPVVGVVGRLDPIKDHAGLIYSFNKVRKEFPESHLVIAGHGPEEGPLRSLNAENVHILGLRKDIPEILGTIDVYAMASLNEGISNTILEAMSCGLPVVSTAVGGTPELIKQGENGFLAQPMDYDGLATYITHYLSSAALRLQHGENNRQIIKKRFTNEAMVAGYEAVWERVAAL